MQCLKSELLCLVEERQAPWRGCLTFGIRDSSCVLDQAPNPPNECQLWCIYCCINCCALNVHAVVTDTACCLSSSERWNAPQWLIRSRWMASTCGAFLSVNTHVRACNQLTVRKKKQKQKKTRYTRVCKCTCSCNCLVCSLLRITAWYNIWNQYDYAVFQGEQKQAFTFYFLCAILTGVNSCHTARASCGNVIIRRLPPSGWCLLEAESGFC